MTIKNKFKKYSIILFIFYGCTSCGIYRQNVVNVPLMQKMGQAQLGGHVSTTGYDGQAGCAITNHLALMVNYSNSGTKRIDNTLINYSIDKHNFGEIGGGYFNKNTKGLIYEFFFIAGKGMSSHFVTGGDTVQGHTPPFTYQRNIDYSRFLIQADFGKAGKKIEYAFSPRIFLLHYFNINDNESKEYLNLPHAYFYSEIALTLRYNILKWLKISGQAGLTIPITGYKAAYYESSPFNASLGLILNINCFNK